MIIKLHSQAFMNDPLPWKDDDSHGVRLAARELVATALYEVAILKAVLECPTIALGDKVYFGRMIHKFIALADEFYDGPWPNAITQAELSKMFSCNPLKRSERERIDRICADIPAGASRRMYREPEAEAATAMLISQAAPEASGEPEPAPASPAPSPDPMSELERLRPRPRRD